MNALTPGKPRPGSRRSTQDREENALEAGESGVRLTMDVDDVPLDQLPDGGMDPEQFARRDATKQSDARSRRSAGAGAEDADASQNANAGAESGDDPDAGVATTRTREIGQPDRPTVRQEGGRARNVGASDGGHSATGVGPRQRPDPDYADVFPDGPCDQGDPAVDSHGRAADAVGRIHQPVDAPVQPVAESWDDDGWAHAEPTTGLPDDRGKTTDPTMAAQAGTGGSAAAGGVTHGRVPRRLAGISVTLSVELGRQNVALGTLMASEPGQLFTLDRLASEPVDVLVNGQLFARGEVVMIGDHFGVRLCELVESEG